MTMENQPFEDVSHIKNGDVPLSFRCFEGVYWVYLVILEESARSEKPQV